MMKKLPFRTKILIGLLVLFTIVYGAVQFTTYAINRGADHDKAKKVSVAPKFPVTASRAQDMRMVMLNHYRLSPDKRFLTAISEINDMLVSHAQHQVLATPDEEGWQIILHNESVGRLDDLPDFADLHALLGNYARKLFRQTPIPEGVKDRGEYAPTSLLDFHADIRLLNRLGVSWQEGDRSVKDIRMAASIFSMLVFMHVDHMGLADNLYARAWALLAMAEQAGQRKMIRERCLLAYGLGYRNQAKRLSKMLPDDDALKAFLQQNIAVVEKLASTPDASQEARYYWLRLLASRHDGKAWWSWYRKYFSDFSYGLPVLASALELGEFQTQEYFAMTLMQMSLVALGQEAGLSSLEKQVAYLKDNPEKVSEVIATALSTLTSPLAAEVLIGTARQLLPFGSAAMMDEFEAGLTHASGSIPSAYLNMDTYKAFYRGYFYSGIYLLSRFYLDQLASDNAGKLLALFIGSEGQTPVSRQVARWYRALYASSSRKLGSAWLQEQFQKLDMLGGRATNRLFQEVARQSSLVDHGLLHSIQYLADHLDSRLQYRLVLLKAAYDHLHDLPLTERLAVSIIEQSPDISVDMASWYAYFSDNMIGLGHILKNGRLTPSGTLYALGLLSEFSKADLSFVRARYEKLLELYPARWDIVRAYASFLGKQEQYELAIVTISTWAALPHEQDMFDQISAVTMMAEMYGKLGKPDKGVDVLRPIALSSYQGGALRTLALLLDMAKQPKAAEEVALRAYRRYPHHLPTMMTLVKIHWQHGEYSRAANVIRKFNQPISEIQWRFSLGRSFAEVFVDKTNADTDRAFAALKNSGIDHFRLMNFIIPIAAQDRKELAFRWMSGLKWNGMGVMVMQIRAYQYLKAIKGKQVALAWLKTRIPAAYRNPSSMMIYREKAYELLWDLIKSPDDGKHGDFVWLMRAAAYATGANFTTMQIGALKDYYSGRFFSSYYDKVGMYIFGQLNKAELLTLADTANKRCEISYYIALRALHNHRLYEASDWFRVAMETGREKMGEYRWSADQLYRWYSAGKRLSEITGQTPVAH